MPRRPKPSAVYLRWDELCRRLDREGPTPELQADWDAWWQEVAAGERLAALPPSDADLVVGIGARIAIAAGDRRGAIDLLRRYLAHPRIEEAQPTDRAFVTCWLACHLLAVGEAAEAVALVRGLLESDDRRLLQDARALARGLLFEFCMDQERDRPAPPELIGLVEDVVRHWRPAVSRRLREGATYRQVADRIDRTRPPEYRRLSPSWE